MKRRTAIVALLSLALVSVWCTTSGVRAEEDGRRATMQAIFESVRTLLAVSTAEPPLLPADSREFLRAARSVEEQADLLAGHIGPGPDAGFLSETLARSAFRVGRYYELGELEAARALVHQMVDVCVACHTRLPSGADSPLAAEFLATTPVQSLSAYQHARLQIATRRFDDALQTLELVLADPLSIGTALDTVAVAYLTVAIRVKRDLERPLVTLTELARRAPEERYRHFATWRETLEREAREPAPDSLQAAERHLVLGNRLDEADENAGLMHYVLASAMTHRLIEAEALRPVELARAYYLLGLSEYRFNPRGWIPQAELFLEMAILNGVGTDTARTAYALLERKISESYRDLARSPVPADVRAHLDHLHSMAFGT